MKTVEKKMIVWKPMIFNRNSQNYTQNALIAALFAAGAKIWPLQVGLERFWVPNLYILSSQMAILRLKTHIFALAYSVFFFYSFHVDFQNLHEFHVDFFKTLTVEFYMKTVEKSMVPTDT